MAWNRGVAGPGLFPALAKAWCRGAAGRFVQQNQFLESTVPECLKRRGGVRQAAACDDAAGGLAAVGASEASAFFFEARTFRTWRATFQASRAGLSLLQRVGHGSVRAGPDPSAPRPRFLQRGHRGLAGSLRQALMGDGLPEFVRRRVQVVEKNIYQATCVRQTTPSAASHTLQTPHPFYVVVAAGQLEQSLSRRFRVERFPHRVSVSASGSNLQIQIQTDPRYFDFVVRAAVREVMGFQVPVARIDDLLQGEIWAALDNTRRPSKQLKDLSDIARLLEAEPSLKTRPAGDSCQDSGIRVIRSKMRRVQHGSDSNRSRRSSRTPVNRTGDPVRFDGGRQRTRGERRRSRRRCGSAHHF